MPQASTPATTASSSSSSYWLGSISHQGTVAFGDDSSYSVFRNVQSDGGAKGDGVTDDFTAINNTMFSGNRCGGGCDSSTTTPAIVYFPSGTYVISKPIVMPYYTQMIGDPLNPPRIIPSADFQGIALIDSDPYEQGVSNPDGSGINWFTNQNNFYRQVRNFVIDISSQPENDGLNDNGGAAGIHWQVAQATSLQNIEFVMKPASSTNKQKGIYMENGSGGFMTDLVFNGGGYGAFLGNQQFTSRNWTFNNCGTAIYMNWNWLWTFKSLTINGGDIGIDMSSLSGNGSLAVGSVMVFDSSIGSTTGIKTSRNATSFPATGGTLLVQNVAFSGSSAIVGADGTTQVLAGGSTVPLYAMGDTLMGTTSNSTGPSKLKRTPQAAQSSADTCATMVSPTQPTADSTSSATVVAAATSSSTASPYSPFPSTNTTSPGSNSTVSTNGTYPVGTCGLPPPALASNTVNQALTAPSMPSALMSGNAVFERAKPQYQDVPASSFVSVKSAGAKGDGVTDDSDAIQSVFDSATPDQVVFFDHGAYRITKTINVPANMRIVGEIWPTIMVDGSSASFSNIAAPQPAFKIGTPGDQGTFEISDMIFETMGSAPGAILVEWNVEEATQGSAGMWDTHFRIGGTAGTGLQGSTCAGNVTHPDQYDPNCMGAFLLMHITQTASAYLENVWWWVADHELDEQAHAKTNIYNGRGLLVESQGPVWLYGTSSEHSQLYNYNFAGAKNVFMGAIQTETAYMQSKPDALSGGFAPNAAYSDPTFEDCTTESCKKTWGLLIQDSESIYMMGGGLYSFFEDYSQTCLLTEDCQENMVDIECSSDVWLYGMTTKASVNMLTINGSPAAQNSDHKNGFGQTLALVQL